MTAFELTVLDFIQEHLRFGFMDILMPLITHLGDGGVIWIALGVVLLLFPKTRKAGFAVLTGLILEVLCCNVILKPFVARVRPCDVNTAQRAVAELKRAGLIENQRRGLRTSVISDQSEIESRRQKKAAELARDFIAQMKLLGYTDAELNILTAEHS